MRSRLLKAMLCAVLCCCFCAGTRFIRKSPEEIDQYLLAHPDIASADRNCIENGRFEIGIHKETLLFLLGEPEKKEVIKEPWATVEHWIYRNHGKETFVLEGRLVTDILENK